MPSWWHPWQFRRSCRSCEVGEWCKKPCDRTQDGCQLEVCDHVVRCSGFNRRFKVRCRPKDGEVKVVYRGDGKINIMGMENCGISPAVAGLQGCGLIGISCCWGIKKTSLFIQHLVPHINYWQVIIEFEQFRPNSRRIKNSDVRPAIFLNSYHSIPCY